MPMLRATAYVTRPLPPPGTTPLTARGVSVVQHQLDEAVARDALLAGVADADALLSLLTDRIDAEVLEVGRRLRVVANLAVGYDNIDLATAGQRGIVVTNTPGVLTEPTAELTWAALLAVARRVVTGDRLVRSGGWRGWSPTQLLGQGLGGRVLGIVGMGKIGVAVARRAQAFGMSVLYCNRTRSPHEAAVGARRVALDDLLREADVVSLHAPLTAETRHLLTAAALRSMKPTALLVNTARGALVDEHALVDALRAGSIAGAALDVFEREPEIASGLAELDNVVLLPHIGSATNETRAAMVQMCCDNILAVLAGEPPLTPVTEGAT